MRSPIRIIAEISAFWFGVNIFFFNLFTFLGYPLSYNNAPVAMAFYYILCSALAYLYYRSILNDYLSSVWLHTLTTPFTLSWISVLAALLLFLSFLPTPVGPEIAPYSDLLFASPWYFVPKFFDILLQQLLIVVLVDTLSKYFHSFYTLSIVYAFLFGLAHVAIYAFSAAPRPYAVIMTLSAFLSALVFPYLIKRINGGLMFTFLIHFLFYIVLSLSYHILPPADYLIE